jgi:Peptidogalycan biosysnthesis/recognition
MPRPPRRVQFAIAERLAHLDHASWDALTASASVFLRRPFLTAFEHARPDNVSPRYAILSLDERPLAAVVLQLVRVEGRVAITTTSPLGSIAQWVDERALILGNLAAWGETGLALAPEADAQLVWREALGLLDRVRRFEKPEGVVNVSFIKDAAFVEHEAVLRAQGYQRAPSGPDMVLSLGEWASHDDYLASLASKRRRAVKKTVEEVDAAGYAVRPLSLDELSAHEQRLDVLYGEVWANAEVRPLRLSGRFFVELKRQLGDDCVVTGLLREGQLDGFGVTLRSGSTCVGYYLGYDRSVEAPLYLRLLGSILEQAFRWRSAQVSFGRTAEDTKARLGAVPGSTGLWVKHRTPPFNWAVSTILGSIETPPPQKHHVFRAPASP